MSENKEVLFLEDLDSDTMSRWRAFMDAHDHAGWRQEPSFGEITAATGGRATFVVGLLGGEVALVGVFSHNPIWRGSYAAEAVCLRGPVFADVTFAQWCLPRISNYFRSLKVGTVRIGPYWRFPEAEVVERVLFAAGYRIFETDDPLGRRTTGIIDIHRSDNEILKSFRNSTRYEIKKAEKLGVEYRVASGASEAEEFFGHLDCRDKERGIARTDPEEFKAIVDVITSHRANGAIINAYFNGTLLSGLLLFRGGRTAFLSKFVVCGECRELFPTLRIAPSVFFKGFQWAKSLGCESVDLEGYSTHNNDHADQVFINRYKAGFNPVACQTLGQYYIECNRSMHTVQRIYTLGGWLTRLPRRAVYRARFEWKKRLVKKMESQKVES